MHASACLLTIVMIILRCSLAVYVEKSIEARVAARPKTGTGLYHKIVNAHHRGELAGLCKVLALNGPAAELGVYHGGFSRHNLINGQFEKYYMIDAWNFRANQTTNGKRSYDKNEVDQSIHDRDYAIAVNATAPWIKSGVAVPMRMYAEAAVLTFPDNHFDFIYVDGGHEFPQVTRDLHAWWPKLKPGGMFAGDDFVDVHDVGLPTGNWHKGLWGVKSAVVRFAEEVGSLLFLTFADHSHAPGERTPWLADDHPDAEWANIIDGQQLRATSRSAIPNPVRSHDTYPAWYMFKAK